MNTINPCPAITNPTLTRIEENIMIKIEAKIPEPYPYTHPIRDITQQEECLKRYGIKV